MAGWIVVASSLACVILFALLLRARRQLRTSRGAFETLTCQAPVGIVTADSEGQCTFANDAWCEISGLTVEETLGQGWSRVVHPDDLAAVLVKWNESVQTRKTYRNELRVVRPDGKLRHVLTTIRPTYDATEKFVNFIGTVIDVTEQHIAQAKAQENETLLQTIIDNSAAAIYLKDDAGRYLLANRKHVDLWPVMKDFQPGMTPFDFYPEDTARSFLESDREVFASGKTKTFEEAITAANGERAYLSVKFPVRDGENRVVAVGGISADITELQQARQALAERERVLRSLIEVQENEKQFLCHEFHDGLIQYAIGSKMILEGIRARDLPEASVAAIDSVINCLTKGIEEGRRVIRGIRPAALDDLGLHAAINDLASDLQESGITVSLTMTPDIDTIPEPLQTTVYRVVQESLNNARKHSGSERVDLDVCRTAAHVEITASDFGCGFEQQAADRNGFGLISIRERARLVAGTCSVESAPGTGTTIKVRLPFPAAE